MKNPFKKQKKKTISDEMNEQVERARRYFHNSIDLSIGIGSLDRLYPGIIKYADIFVYSRIQLDYGVELPEEFLFSCEQFGLRIKSVRKRDYRYNQKPTFYMLIEFENNVDSTEDCDDK